MRYLSVCAGIEAATVAWHPLGWEPVAFSEIDKFPSAVLAHHYPDVPNYGDMTDHERWPESDIDVLVGGTPCQSFSVAGLRQGMADPRGNLALIYLAITEQYRPRWLVWENVPGVLSANGGRDFGSIIGGMVELGYSPCWRVLDAQYFGLAQRRRRVFVVASSRDWRDSAEVLLEPSCLLRNPAPRRPSRKRTTGDVAHSLRGRGFDASEDGTGRGTPLVAKSLKGNSGGIDREDMHTILADIYPTLDADEAVEWGNNQWVDAGKPILCPDVANPLTARMYKGINTTLDEGQTPIPVNIYPKQGQGAELQASETDTAMALTDIQSERGTRVVGFKSGQGSDAGSLGASEHVAPTLNSNDGGNKPAVAFAENRRGELRESPVTDSVKVGGGKPGQGYQAVREGLAVRRLTPTECERLQGFPDGYTDIPGASDSGRYKALGNSMAVPVMRWIGERIDKVSRAR